MRSTLPYPRTRLTAFWPPDFEPVAVIVFATSSLDPLVLECENCKLRAACAPGRYARPDCKEGATQAPHETPKQLPREERYEMILSALREHGPQTIYDLMRRGVGKYGSLRNRIYELIAQGRIKLTLVPHGITRIAIYSLEEQ